MGPSWNRNKVIEKNYPEHLDLLSSSGETSSAAKPAAAADAIASTNVHTRNSPVDRDVNPSAQASIRERKRAPATPGKPEHKEIRSAASHSDRDSCLQGDKSPNSGGKAATMNDSAAFPNASSSAAMPVDMVTSSGRDLCPESDGAPTSAAKPAE